jgi:hypothetical protein
MIAPFLVGLLLWQHVSADPYKVGPFYDSLGTVGLGNHSVPDTNVGVHLFVVAPTSVDDSTSSLLPVFLFWTAFAGKIPSQMYLEYFEHVASHGIVVVGMDAKNAAENKPDFQPELAQVLVGAIDWMKSGNLDALMQNSGFTVSPYMDKVVLGGHSAGGHTVTQLVSDGCNSISALVLMDPVDGLAPWAVFDHISEYASVIHPPKKVDFVIPLLHLENKWDPFVSMPQYPNYPSCAPEAMSNDRFFNAWRGPAWQINATYFGHMDSINAGYVDELNHIFDIFCAGNRTSSNAEYISLVGGATVAFMDMFIYGDSTAQIYIEDASLMPTEVILRQKSENGDGFQGPYRGFCKNLR